MRVNLKKLANEIERATGLRPISYHTYSELTDPDIEFAGGYTIQITDLTPDRPYVLYGETNGVMKQLGDFRTQNDLVEFIRSEVAKE